MYKGKCEVCHFEYESESMEDLMNIQFTHAEKDEHLVNVIKYLMLDTGAKTLEELPEKLEEYMNGVNRDVWSNTKRLY